MKILFDVSTLFACSGGGINNYLAGLLPRLSEEAERNGDELSFINFYFRGKGKCPDFLPPGRVRHFRFPVKLLNHLWHCWGIPDLSRLGIKADVFHSPHFSLPVISGAKKILTVNDITYLLHPEYFTLAGRALNEYGYKYLLPRNIARADRIIAISQNTKDDIVEHFRIPEDKVSVVHIGCGITEAQDVDKSDCILSHFGLTKSKFIYFPVGTFEPRKNIPATIKAFLYAKHQTGDIKLAISGVGDKSFLKDIPDSEDIVFLRWDNEDKKQALYQGSLFVVYPSLYEGFGIPVLEAMAAGKAVLTSNSSSIPEVAGDAAMLIKPEDTEEIRQAFQKLLDDDALRVKLENRARQRAELFSEAKMAQDTYGVYKSVS
ncbi:MAG: glycosyltransferase family 4 protein [Victivallales bacterium]|nr:glycosyltransferase family 4 protein [Victivallales bacterium]